jgi:hypothetical protein
MKSPLELNSLRAVLIDYAQQSKTASYQQLLKDLSIAPPRSIQKLTTALEHLTREDVLLERPILATIAVQKGEPFIPRQGFFQFLRELDIYNGADTGPVAEMWHLDEVQKVWKNHKQ